MNDVTKMVTDSQRTTKVAVFALFDYKVSVYYEKYGTLSIYLSMGSLKLFFYAIHYDCSIDYATQLSNFLAT